MHLLGFSSFDFKNLAFQELRKYSRSHLVTLISALIDGCSQGSTSWGRPSIRAHLIKMKEKSLQMDFVLEGDNKSKHILNAGSPGFTCSIPFSKSKYVVERVQVSKKTA
ncbi:hypothetical protein ACTRXD_03455 [Nitrospira sp. T9]